MNLGDVREHLDKTGCRRDVGGDGAIDGGKDRGPNPVRIKRVCGIPQTLRHCPVTI
jgi:hypothetical protein